MLKALTDSNGNFLAPVLPVGSYRISVSAVGFKTEVLHNVTLRVADRLKVNVKLSRPLPPFASRVK